MSGRGGHRRGRAGEHGHTHRPRVFTVGDDPWVGADAIADVYDLTAAVRTAAQGLSAEQLLETLEHNGDGHVLSHLGVKAKRLSLPVASQVLSQMRTRPAHDLGNVLSTVGMGSVILLNSPMSPAALADMCSSPGEDIPDALIEHGVSPTELMEVLEALSGLAVGTPAEVALGMLALIVGRHPSATLALAFLTDIDPAAQAAWESLAAAGQPLPPKPIGDLAEVVAAMHEGVTAWAKRTIAALSGALEADAPAEPEPVEELWPVYELLHALLPQFAASVAAGDFDHHAGLDIARALRRLTSTQLPTSGTAAHLQAAWDEAHKPAEPHEVNAWRVMHLEGPEEIADDTVRVRQRAWDALEQQTTDTGMAALTGLVDLVAARHAGEAVGFAATREAESAAHRELAEEQVIAAAVQGWVSLPADPGEDARREPLPVRPGEPAPPETGAQPDDSAPRAVLTHPDAPAYEAHVDEAPETLDPDEAHESDESPEADEAPAAEEQPAPTHPDAVDPTTAPAQDAADAQPTDTPHEHDSSGDVELATPETTPQADDDSALTDEAAPAPAADLDPEASGAEPVADREEEEDEADLLAALAAAVDAGAGSSLFTPTAPTEPEEVQPETIEVSDTTPEPALESEPAQQAESLTWESEQVRSAADAAADDMRLSLAADIAAAADAPDPSVAARRAAALAADLRAPGGQLAAAYSALSATLRRDALSDDRPGQLLTWAAAARIALLAPDAGPGLVLEEFAPCVADLPALAAIGDALIAGTRSGAIVLPEARTHLSTLQAVEREMASSTATIEQLLETRTRRVMQYQPANAVYQTLFGRGGLIGELLDATTDPATSPGELRKQALALRGEGEREAKGAHARMRKSNPIFEPVMRDLVSRWEEGLDAVIAWCDARTRQDEAVEAPAETWQTKALAKVRAEVAAHTAQAMEELISGRLAPVANAVRDLVRDALDATNGQAPDARPEPAKDLIAHADLLALGALLPAPLESLTGQHLTPLLPAMVELAHREAPDLSAQYQQLADGGHHDLTEHVIALASARQPNLEAALRLERSRAVLERGQQREETTAALRRSLDTQRMSGGMSEESWARLSTRIEALGANDRTDFGRLEHEAARLQDDLAALLAERVAETLARIEQRAADDTRVAAVAARLSELAADGNIAAAEEYMEQAAAGEDLPEQGSDTNRHLKAFYPRVPNVLEGTQKSAEVLYRIFDSGKDGAGLLAKAGLDIENVSAGRRRAARAAFSGFRDLLTHATSRELPRKALVDVLAQAGIDFSSFSPDGPISGKRRWVKLSGVTVTGKALTPALGSGRAPDPSTLRVLLCWGESQPPKSIVDWVRDEPNDRTVLALWLGAPITSAQRRELTEASRGRPHPVVAVLDIASLLYLAVQDVSSLSTFASISLPFTGASPFKDTPGDAAPEMFYGRRDELANVMDFEGSCFVSGGRQLGKSALLRAAERSYPLGDEGRVAVLRNIFTVGVDGDASRLWPALWGDLAARGICPTDVPGVDGVVVGEQLAGHIGTWLAADPSRGLLVLLDEADAFLDADAANNKFVVVDQCRNLMSTHRGRVKFVFAGLHRTIRFDSLPNQPLSHLGQITVGPLAPAHAHSLITRPLAAIGLQFADPTGTPARVLALANNMPALIQLFGAALVRHMTSKPVGATEPPQAITDDDIDTVWDDPELRRAFRDKYVLTLNLDHRYLVIAFTVAFAAHVNDPGTGLSLAELSRQARENWPEGFETSGADDFRALVSECVDLGLLSRDGTRYRMRTPTVLRLLGTRDEVMETLATASDELTVPDAAAGGTYRRPLPDGNRRAPLTEAQLGDILTGQGAVTLVTGTPVTGISAVAVALTAAVPGGAVTSSRKVSTAEEAAALSGRVLGIWDMRGRSVKEVRAALEVPVAAQAALVVIADTSSVGAWPDADRRVVLRRIDRTGLRLLVEEAGLPFHSEAERAQLMDATGGWPTLVDAVLTSGRGQAVAPTVGAILEEAHERRREAGRTMVSGLVGGVNGLGPVLSVVADLTHEQPEPLLEIAEFVSASAEDLSEEAAVAHLQLLSDLGAVVVTGEGMLQVEPTLAACLHGAEEQ